LASTSFSPPALLIIGEFGLTFSPLGLDDIDLGLLRSKLVLLIGEAIADVDTLSAPSPAVEIADGLRLDPRVDFEGDMKEAMNENRLVFKNLLNSILGATNFARNGLKCFSS
jgi:hypothetical protein